MTIRIIGGSMLNNGRAGISLPSDADVEINGVHIAGNGVHGIEIRDGVDEFLKSLPPGLPPELLLDALEVLGGSPTVSPGARLQALQSGKLSQWLEKSFNVAGNASSVLQGVVAAYSAGLTLAAVKAFFGMA